MKLAELRKRYPKYDNVDDLSFASLVHKKYYKDMDFKDFVKKASESEGEAVVKAINKLITYLEKMEESNHAVNSKTIGALEKVKDNKADFAKELGESIKKNNSMLSMVVKEILKEITKSIGEISIKPEIKVPEMGPFVLEKKNGHKEEWSFEMGPSQQDGSRSVTARQIK